MKKYENKKYLTVLYFNNNITDMETLEHISNRVIEAIETRKYVVVLSDYLDKIEFVPKSTWACIIMKILSVLHDFIKGKKYDRS